MWPDRVSNPGPLTYESGALPIALRGPACYLYLKNSVVQIRIILYGTDYLYHRKLCGMDWDHTGSCVIQVICITGTMWV